MAAKRDSKAKKVTGGCLCGAVRYESTDAPAGAAYCHCRMCQRQVGGPAGIFVSFPLDKFRVTRGRLKRYQSSPIAKRGFCARCGTPISCESIEHATTIAITIGSLDNPAIVKPSSHWGVESQLDWFEAGKGLPRNKTPEDPRVSKVAAKIRRGELLPARNV
jgi:hypothetical protein